MIGSRVLIQIIKGHFCTALLLFFLTAKIFGQEANDSTSVDNNILEKYNEIQISPIDTLVQIKFDSLLQDLGIEKKIFFFTTEVPLFEFLWMTQDRNDPNEYLGITVPDRSPSYFIAKENGYFNTLKLLHAIGHQVNINIGENNKSLEIKEIEATRFSGYYMNKLGWPKESYISYMQSNSKKVEPTLKLKNIDPIRFNSAFEDGWHDYAMEQSLHEDTGKIDVYKTNKILVDSLMQLGKKEYNRNFLVSANAYSKAYQNSNGKRISTLYWAFDQFLKAKEFESALRHGNTLFKNGAGFLDYNNYTQLFNNMAMIYEIKRDYENALKFLNIAHSLDIKNTDLLDRKAAIISRQSNPKELINTLIERIKIGSVSIDLYYKLAGAYRADNQPLEAIKYYKRILAMNPKHINTRVELAKLYIKEGVDIVNILNSKDLSKNQSFDIKKSIEAKNTLWENAENVLKEGLITNPKNPYLKQELKNLKTLKRTKKIALHDNF